MLETGTRQSFGGLVRQLELQSAKLLSLVTELCGAITSQPGGDLDKQSTPPSNPCIMDRLQIVSYRQVEMTRKVAGVLKEIVIPVDGSPAISTSEQ